jgi:iduronate 2-sulfatase
MKYNRWERNPIDDHDFATNVRKHYAACVTYADASVGRIIKVLQEAGIEKNTVIVLWGDHGWHLGEKQHWRKHALWETTTRTTLIISAPGQLQKNLLCWRPVSLIDLYPTLVELCGLPSRNGLDGHSIVPLLQDPKMEW